jgi:ribose 5-phosphate isomerase A
LATLLRQDDCVPTEQERLKQQAGEFAAQFISSGMIVGLGHGSTAIYAIRRIAQLFKEGALKDILGIPCSNRVAQDAAALGIPLTSLAEHPIIDITIDGADEVARNLDVIKGGGGALLREKIVAQATKREIIVVDESKLSPVLGTHFAVPVEVATFGWQIQAVYLETLGAKVTVRRDTTGEPFLTDQGNYLLDCQFGAIANPDQLAAQLSTRAGIIEHGLFLGLVSEVIVAHPSGIEHLKHK